MGRKASIFSGASTISTTTREVLREPQDLRGMDPAVSSEAEVAPQGRRPCQVMFPRLLDDRFIEGLVVIVVAVPEEDPRQLCVLRKMHDSPSHVRSSCVRAVDYSCLRL
jgi:hypothetical protein